MQNGATDKKRKAWLIWMAITAPLGVITALAIQAYGYGRVMPILLACLGAVMLFQRFVRKRSWNAIIWGR